MLTSPQVGVNLPLDRIVIGMHDSNTGLDLATFRGTADFVLGGAKLGENLVSKLKSVGDGVWEWKLNEPITTLPCGTLSVSVKDRQGNRSEIVRRFSVK